MSSPTSTESQFQLLVSQVTHLQEQLVITQQALNHQVTLAQQAAQQTAARKPHCTA
jgi:hypothetical protein